MMVIDDFRLVLVGWDGATNGTPPLQRGVLGREGFNITKRRKYFTKYKFN